MTIKLYDYDSHLKEFQANVTACRGCDGQYQIVLDQTAFFPTGGGQAADTGTLNDVPVVDVSEVGQSIVHWATSPIPVGTTVNGTIDWSKRFDRMQQHSGEHIVSGIIHQLYGYLNVGFHMGSNAVTIDYDGPLTAADLKRIEHLANEAVANNVPVSAYYPEPEKLSSIDYRSKLDLTENVRIVSIEGYDTCACCAPHVSNTGEIGLIKLLDCTHHKGGVRINMLCGFRALEDYNNKFEQVTSISKLLSAKQYAVSSAVTNLQQNFEEVKQKLALANRKLAQSKLQTLSETSGNLLLFEPDFDAVTLREMVNTGMQLCSGICAAFSGEDGNYRYVIGSRFVDLSSVTKELNLALHAKGGGTASMIQGSANCTKHEIETYFDAK
jgi:alanyl-tRNA synthetase